MNQNDKCIVAVVGMPGTGKSTVVDMLVKKYHMPYIHFGGITMEEMRRRGLEETQANEKKIRQELRKHHGMDAYATLSVPKIKDMLKENDVVLIDGLYSWSEYIYLREVDLAKISLITIISMRKNRYDRLKKREYRPLDEKEAEKRDFAEISTLEKGGPIALCDYYILNDNTVEKLEENVYNLVKNLLKIV